MNRQAIVEQLDREISRLQQVRELLAPATGESSRNPGRPKRALTTDSAAGTPEQTRKRQLTPEGKQRIRDAQKARWAARRSAAGPVTAVEEVTASEPSVEVPFEV